MEITTIHFDGLAGPTNPGAAVAASIIDLPDGTFFIDTVDLGRQTNNVAEYSAAILGLKEALRLGCKRIKLVGDSQLVSYQLQGRYKCKNSGLLLLHQEAMQLLNQFESYVLEWVPRLQNSRAEVAAFKYLQAKQSVELALAKLELE